MTHPHFKLPGASAVNGQAARRVWQCSEVFEAGKLTIVAAFPSSHTPVCQATCLALSANVAEMNALGVQMFGICTNYIADVEAWVAAQGITIPVLSDFSMRTAAACLAGLNEDGTSRRATTVWDGAGNEIWRYAGTDNAQLHAEGAMEFVRSYASQTAGAR